MFSNLGFDPILKYEIMSVDPQPDIYSLFIEYRNHHYSGMMTEYENAYDIWDIQDCCVWLINSLDVFYFVVSVPTSGR